MTKEQYRTALAALGLNIKQAARFLGVCERTSRYYASGAKPVPPAMAALLWLMMSKNLQPATVEAIVRCFR